MFVQRLSAQGVPEWVVVGGDGGGRRSSSGSATSTSGSDDDGGRADASASAAVADALAFSLYADMLHDRPRAEAYAAALTAVVSAVVESGQRSPLILDIGTGTGLLAVLAARAAAAAGATDVSVVAVDQFPPMVELARQTVALAGCGHAISVRAGRSEEVEVGGGGGASLPRRADVVVAEILDSLLLGEGALPTAVDVGARLLAPGGVAIPARGRVLAQPIACPDLRARWDGTAWCGTPAGLGGDPVPRPLHLDRLGVTPAGPATVVLEVDLTRPGGARGRARTEVRLRAGPPPPPPVDALALWWEVDLTPDGRVRLDTTPAWVRGGGRASFSDHWRACWVPPGAGPPTASLTVEVEYGPADLSVRVIDVDGVVCEQPTSLAGAYAPAGGGLAASADRAAALAAAVAHAAPASKHALTLGDGPLPALVARVCASVTAVVSSSAAAAAAVRAVAPTVEVVRTLPPPRPRPPATLLVAEPHYRSTDGRPPWEALLRLLRDRAALIAAGALATHAAVCPAGARVMVVGAAAPDLARTAGPVGSVAGVDMAPFDAASGERKGRWLAPCRPVEAQVGAFREVTDRAALGGGVAALADFHAVGSLPARLEGRAVLTATAGASSIDALVFWVEYDAAGGASTWTSGQARALFRLPAAVAVRSPGGLAVTLDLDVAAEAELGGGLAVRADVGVGK